MRFIAERVVATSRQGRALAVHRFLSDCARRLFPQPTVAFATSLLGLATLAAAWYAWIWTARPPREAISPDGLLMAVCLSAAVVAAYHYPIHVRRKIKVSLASIPLYLIATLLPPPLAVTAGVIGVLVSELSVRARRGTTMSTLLGGVWRWAPIILLAALVVHAPATAAGRTIGLLAAGPIMAVGDYLTIPLVLAPLLHERPLRVILPAVRDTYEIESIQYTAGILGVLVVGQWPVALLLLAAPALVIHHTFRSVKRVQARLAQFA